MSTTTGAAAATTGPILTGKNKVGLVLAAILGVLDVASPFLMPNDPNDPGVAGPPIGILILDAVLGLVTVLAVVYTWRTANRIGARIIAGTRIISALSALPAFFVTGVPAFVVATVGVFVVVTIATIILVLSRPATTAR